MGMDVAGCRRLLDFAIRAVVSAALTLYFGSVASADSIELKTGERIEGAFRQATAAGAVIEVAGQSITIPLRS
jgi:hypothetical protein